MKQIPIKIDTWRTVSMAIMVAILLSAVLRPMTVEATCIVNGNETTCDEEDDAVTSDPADEANESVSNIISGNEGDDKLYGANAYGENSTVTDTISGGDGNDIVSGGNATGSGATVDVTLNGDGGNDMLLGGSGYSPNSAVHNTISGGEGDDWIHPGTAPLTTNMIDGGEGSDTIDYNFFYNTGPGEGVTVDLSNPGPQVVGPDQSTDTISNVENLVGTGREDTLTGTTGANNMASGPGDDVVNGNGGDDYIFGGDGDDTITGSNGQFTLAGEDGNDSLILEGRLGTSPAAAANADGGAGQNVILFMANAFGNVILSSSSGLDTLDFSQYNSSVTLDLANTSSAQLVGGEGESSLWVTLNGLFSDVIGAIGFTNTIDGNSLDNNLTGGDQDDFLDGGGGNNVLNGGGGTDTDTAATAVSGGITNQSGDWFSIEAPQPLAGETETPEVTETSVASETPVVTETPAPAGNPTAVPANLIGGFTLAELAGNGGPGIVPVTGGMMRISCDTNSFRLPNGDMVVITGLCGDYWVSIQSQSTDLPAGLPAGSSVLSGMFVQVFQGTDQSNLTPVSTLPGGANIQLSFLLSDPVTQVNFLSLGSTGGWLELENGQVTGRRYSVSTQQSGITVIATE